MEIIDDQPKQPEHRSELDSLRIRQLTSLRRGAIRARSWCLIAAAVCAVGSFQLLINTALIIHPLSSPLRATAYLLTAIAGCIVAVYFLRRAKSLKHEIEKPLLDAPTTPPDFSTLSDGSQRWKDLENIE